MVFEYSLGAGGRRIDGITPSELEDMNIQLDSIMIVHGYVHGQSGSEYHFNLGLDPRLQNVSVFCDDTHRNGSDEYLAILQRMSARVHSEIDPATGQGALVASQDKKSLVDTLKGVFDEFNVPEKDRTIVVDYKV